MTHFSNANQIDHILANETPTGSHWQVAIANAADGNIVYEGQSDEQPQDGYELLSFTKLVAAQCIRLQGILPSRGVRIAPEDKREGGILNLAPDLHETTLGEVAKMALTRSDNTALRTMVRILGGPLVVNDMIDADMPGLHITRFELPEHLEARVSDSSLADVRIDAKAPFFCGNTTAREVTDIFRQVLDSNLYRPILEHGNFNYGLRRRVDRADRYHDKAVPEPKPRLLRRAQMLHAIGRPSGKLINRLITVDFPRTIFPNKEGTDGDEGEFHDVAFFPNGYICAVLSRNNPNHQEGDRQPAYYVHGLIGEEIIKADAV